MKRTLILICLLFCSFSFSQNAYEKAEGYYNLSEFEVASGLYLLKDKTFFFFSTFGNVDLKLYGTYSISDNNKLSFKIADELKKEFYVYGYTSETLSETIHLEYEKPYEQKTEQLYAIIKDQRYDFPEFDTDKTLVSLDISSSSNTLLSLGYKYLDKDYISTTVNLNGANSIVIYHNYFYDMTMEVSKMAFVLENGLLKQDANNLKTYQKKFLKENVITQVTEFITTLKNRTTVMRNGIIYTKL